MFLQKILFMWLLINVSVISLSLHKINLQNTKVFEITSDNKNYDEQSESEMIQPTDLANFKFYTEDGSRYKPLHSYVDNYNKRNIMNKMQHINGLIQLKPNVWENSNMEKSDKPFIAGFKEDLDKIKSQHLNNKVHQIKRNNEQHSPSSWKIFNDNANINKDKEESIFSKSIREKYTTINENNLFTYVESTEAGEETYDYEKFKKEYDEQVPKDIYNNKTLNYTEEKVEHPKEALKKLLNFKNCTVASKKFGIRTIDCLLYNYDHQKNKPVVKKIVWKIWLIIKVWFLIYICFVIPCWCQKGWCCCCFRCKFCFPRKRIQFAKQYYAINPPGVLSKQVKKQEKQLITYVPTEFEKDAYEKLEAAIKNI